MRNQSIGTALSAALLALLPAEAAQAQTIGITPVGLSLTADHATATVQVTNRGTDAAAVQLRWFAWSQSEGEDRLEPTSELLVSPPLAKIAPGGTQTVRVLLKAKPREREASYRILFDQIPTAPSDGGVRVALRISIPVFGLPPAPVKSLLSWTSRVQRTGEAEVVIANTGPRHARLNQIRIGGGAGALTIDGPSNLYLLPGSTHRVRVRGTGINVGTALRISASSDEGEVAATTILQPPL
jgi:fimbrial chaperone protein